MTETKHEIHKANLPKLQERVAKLARKARRYGLPEPSLVVEQEITRERLDDLGHRTGYVDPVLIVRLTGEISRLEGGWRLIAIVDHRGEINERGYLISQLPWTINDGIEVPENYRTDKPWCDHCQTQRYRTDTFVLLNDAGEWKRVGRQCLKNYTGDQSARRYATYLYDLQALDFAEYREIESQKSYLDTKGFLAITAAFIEKFGWVSRGAAQKNPKLVSTADDALDYLYNGHDEVEIDETHEAQAEQAVAWLEETLGSQDKLNDYEWNLVVAASRDYTALKHVGLVASLIPTWKRRDKKLASENGNPSQHQGEIKERLDLVLTVTKRVDLDSDWGVYRITIMTDENENVYVWKTGKFLEEDTTYKIRGTVKEHEDYNGIAQTILTRCKFEEVS